MSKLVLVFLVIGFIGCSHVKVKTVEQESINLKNEPIAQIKKPVRRIEPKLIQVKKILDDGPIQPIKIKKLDIKAISPVRKVRGINKGFSQQSEKVLDKGKSVGTFEKIEWGDYANLKISNPNGSQSFFLRGGPPLLMGEFQEKLKGKKVRVSWVKVRRYVPEVNETMEVIETEDICSFSNIYISSKLSKGMIKRCRK